MDGCTGWLDGWPVQLGGTGEEWLHCCAKHDEVYSQIDYHTIAEYIRAHFELSKCVAEVSPVMAALMFAGLVTFGFFVVNARNLKIAKWPK